MTVALPWRLANAHHLYSRRAANRSGQLADGVDFYGRPTDAIWFNLPRGRRRTLVVFLLLNTGIQWVHQVLHIAYHSYDTAFVRMPGRLLLPLTMVTSASCGGVAAVLQWRAETVCRRASPNQYPPGPMELTMALYTRWRAGAPLGALLRPIPLAQVPESTDWRGDEDVDTASV